jgi:ABC-type nickel/cobalt efflux system permease component RcnA
MKSTHNTLLAYGKGIAAALVMVMGTAVMISAFSTAEAPLKGYSQNKLAQNTSPLVNASNIEHIKGKQYQQMPDLAGTINFRASKPS